MKRALPYLLPHDRVKAEDWLVTSARGLPLGSGPLGWDYNSRIDLSRRVHIDVAGLISDCALDSDSPLVVCVRVWTTRARIRTLLSRTPITYGASDPSIAVAVEGSGLGGTLVVETTVELGGPRSARHPFSAHRLGTVLWRETRSVALEGDGGLLPIAPVSFAETSRLPNDARWYVSMDASDWAVPAMGCLLVLINTGKPAIAQALEAPDDDPVAAALWSSLAIDVVSDVLSKAFEDPTFPSAPQERPEDVEALTLAGLVMRLVRGYLKRPTETDVEAFDRLKALRASDPSMFCSEIQHALNFQEYS